MYRHLQDRCAKANALLEGTLRGAAQGRPIATQRRVLTLPTPVACPCQCQRIVPKASAPTGGPATITARYAPSHLIRMNEARRAVGKWEGNLFPARSWASYCATRDAGADLFVMRCSISRSIEFYLSKWLPNLDGRCRTLESRRSRIPSANSRFPCRNKASLRGRVPSFTSEKRILRQKRWCDGHPAIVGVAETQRRLNTGLLILHSARLALPLSYR